MTVGELKELLSEVSDDRIVVLSNDPGGNSYDTLYSCWTASYADKEVGLEPADLTEEMREQGYTEEDVCEGEPAFVLSP